jgi:hypothetical protein
VLRVIPGELAIWRLPPDVPTPVIDDSEFVSVTRTPEELSIVSSAGSVPPDVPCETGWSRIAVEGPLSFDQIGVIADLTAPLAREGISVFVISTFDTDHLLVKSDRLEDAATVLRKAGHTVLSTPPSGR